MLSDEAYSLVIRGGADGLIFRACRPFSGLVDICFFSLCFKKDDSFQSLRVSHGLGEEVLFIYIYIYFFFFFLATLVACGILLPQPGIESGPSAVKAWSPNHWTTREFPKGRSFYRQNLG